MANSPVDKSRQFVESGMTLITDQAADRWLKMAHDRKARKNLTNFLSQAEWDDGFVGK